MRGYIHLLLCIASQLLLSATLLSIILSKSTEAAVVENVTENGTTNEPRTIGFAAHVQNGLEVARILLRSRDQPPIRCVRNIPRPQLPSRDLDDFTMTNLEIILPSLSPPTCFATLVSFEWTIWYPRVTVRGVIPEAEVHRAFFPADITLDEDEALSVLNQAGFEGPWISIYLCKLIISGRLSYAFEVSPELSTDTTWNLVDVRSRTVSVVTRAYPCPDPWVTGTRAIVQTSQAALANKSGVETSRPATTQVAPDFSESSPDESNSASNLTIAAQPPNSASVSAILLSKPLPMGAAATNLVVARGKRSLPRDPGFLDTVQNGLDLVQRLLHRDAPPPIRSIKNLPYLSNPSADPDDFTRISIDVIIPNWLTPPEFQSATLLSLFGWNNWSDFLAYNAPIPDEEAHRGFFHTDITMDEDEAVYILNQAGFRGPWIAIYLCVLSINDRLSYAFEEDPQAQQGERTWNMVAVRSRAVFVVTGTQNPCAAARAESASNVSTNDTVSSGSEVTNQTIQLALANQNITEPSL